MKQLLVVLFSVLPFFSLSADPVVLDGPLRNSQNVTIQSIIEWQDTNNIYFVLSNGEICFILATEDKLYSLVLAAYISGEKLGVHTFQEDRRETASVFGYRVHRIWMQKQ